MHHHTIGTAEDGTWQANVNGDFSGDVLLTTPFVFPDKGRFIPQMHDYMGETRWQLRIPFEVMLELVGVYFGSEAVGRIEQMTGREFLNAYCTRP